MNLRKPLPLLLILLLLGSGSLFFFGKEGVYHQNRQLQQKNREIAANRVIIDSLRLEIRSLTGDTAAIERVARERLGMIREGEKLYKFVVKRK